MYIETSDKRFCFCFVDWIVGLLSPDTSQASPHCRLLSHVSQNNKSPSKLFLYCLHFWVHPEKNCYIVINTEKQFSGLKIILLDVYFVFNIEIHKSFKNTSWFDLTWVEPKKTWSCWLPPCLYVCYHYRECCTTIVQQNITVKSK